MRKVIRLVAVAAVLTMLVSACGDDDADGDSDGGASADLSITAKSFSYTPSEWTVAGNTDITVELTNASASDEHEWAILNLGVTITDESEFVEEIVLGEIEAVVPGEKGSETFNLAPGTYQVICALEGHFNAGMTGTLTVTG